MDKKLPSKTFCAAPWHATYYKESMNKYKMCCVFDKWEEAKSPEDYFNSDTVKEVNAILAVSGCRDNEKEKEQ